jgi:ABC-type branched-subunit amino acid transport system substrate-binding protein
MNRQSGFRVQLPRNRTKLRHPLARLAALLACAALLAACASNGGSSSGGASGRLQIANFDPFSGPNSEYGFYEQAGCVSAVNLINADGGALGHKFYCSITDSRGDPADAVPAAQKLLATSSNLVAIVDQDSGVLTATVPLFNTAHITDLSIGGDIPFDTNHYAYFWRTIPGDDVAGYSFAAYLNHNTKYTKVASVFTNDQSAQGNVPGLLKGSKNLGLSIVSNETLALDQTSYETEIHSLIAAHPQVMVLESDPQTAGVLFGELKQANGLMPTVLTSGTLGTSFDRAMVAAIGRADYLKYFVRVVQFAPSAGYAWQVWDRALMAAGKAGQVKTPSVYASSIYSEDPYDNVNMIALAMLEAHSTNPVKYNAYIKNVTDGSTVVHTFAQGKAAIEAGKTINYVGVEGQIHFDKYHNSAGVWGVFQPLTNKLLGVIPASLVSGAEGHH